MAKVIWFTGISGSGKTTLAEMLKTELERTNGHVELLDGDVVRDFFNNDLGYSREERMLNVRRIAFAAHLLCKNGINVIVANIAPYYEVRDFIRSRLGENYIQIFLNSSLEAVVARDTKGHYEKYHNGEEKNLIGLDDAYDVPRNPDLTLSTDQESAEKSFNKLREYINKRMEG